jgi:16S rRNA processing protein RimM
MNKSECFHLGHVAKLHGFKGEVSLFLDVTTPQDYATLDALFIEINGHLTPFFVQSIQLTTKNFAKVKFEGVETETQAKTLLGKSLFLPLQVLPELTGNDFYDHEVIGFEVHDVTFGKVGILEQIIDLDVNPLIQVMAGEKEVLIPLRKELIIRVDRTKKELILEAPPGLIDMYLSNS